MYIVFLFQDFTAIATIVRLLLGVFVVGVIVFLEIFHLPHISLALSVCVCVSDCCFRFSWSNLFCCARECVAFFVVVFAHFRDYVAGGLRIRKTTNYFNQLK